MKKQKGFKKKYPRWTVKLDSCDSSYMTMFETSSEEMAIRRITRTIRYEEQQQKANKGTLLQDCWRIRKIRDTDLESKEREKKHHSVQRKRCSNKWKKKEQYNGGWRKEVDAMKNKYRKDQFENPNIQIMQQTEFKQYRTFQNILVRKFRLRNEARCWKKEEIRRCRLCEEKSY